MESLTIALSYLTTRDFSSSSTSTSSLSGSYTSVTSDSTMESGFTSTENLPTGSSDVIPFNDRSMEIRNARLANALDSLDEDLPENVDDSIKNLLRNYTDSKPSALSPMKFIVNDKYLDYKSNLAAKRALEKKLPKSKGRRFQQPSKID